MAYLPSLLSAIILILIACLIGFVLQWVLLKVLSWVFPNRHERRVFRLASRVIAACLSLLLFLPLVLAALGIESPLLAASLAALPRIVATTMAVGLVLAVFVLLVFGLRFIFVKLFGNRRSVKMVAYGVCAAIFAGVFLPVIYALLQAM